MDFQIGYNKCMLLLVEVRYIYYFLLNMYDNIIRKFPFLAYYLWLDSLSLIEYCEVWSPLTKNGCYFMYLRWILWCLLSIQLSSSLLYELTIVPQRVSSVCVLQWFPDSCVGNDIVLWRHPLNQSHKYVAEKWHWQ